jgi:hypothetical protein
VPTDRYQDKIITLNKVNSKKEFDANFKTPVLGTFFFFKTFRPLLGPTPTAIKWVQLALSQEVKRLGREAHR